MAKATRQQTTAVAGYDLTFAPVKSVSTLWALADRDVAKEIEAAHHAAVEATLSWLEKEVLFTRHGRGGLQQVRAKGLIAGMFTHRDARSSDPHLHTHVAVSNKAATATSVTPTLDTKMVRFASAAAPGSRPRSPTWSTCPRPTSPSRRTRLRCSGPLCVRPSK
jgi:conjugative relaxase-like TrwC/TraI family protein